MSTFKAKMHQIQFRLELRPRPRWESLQRSTRPLTGFKGPLLRGGERKRGSAVRGGVPSTFFCGPTRIIRIDQNIDLFYADFDTTCTLVYSIGSWVSNHTCWFLPKSAGKWLSKKTNRRDTAVDGCGRGTQRKNMGGELLLDWKTPIPLKQSSDRFGLLSRNWQLFLDFIC